MKIMQLGLLGVVLLASTGLLAAQNDVAKQRLIQDLPSFFIIPQLAKLEKAALQLKK